MTRVVQRVILSAVVLTAVASPLHAQTQTAKVERAVGPLADSLRAFAMNMAETLRRLDTKGTFALYGNLAQFVHVESGNVVPWTDLARDMTQFFATVRSNPVSVVGEPGVTIMDMHNAVVYVTHRMEASEGRAAHEGVWTGVLHRFPDGWKIVHSHSSDRRPH